MDVTTVGVDLAKHVFQIHGVTQRGTVSVRKQLKRTQVEQFFANLPPCLVGMEACASAHYWARRIQSYGHTVKLMAPQFVKPVLPHVILLPDASISMLPGDRATRLSASPYLPSPQCSLPPKAAETRACGA
jgi:hypothetical protein